VRNLDELFAALAKSRFRRSFHLGGKDLAYLHSKGLPEALTHAEGFIAKRLAPAVILNDGKQTPMRGHPVFVAQHATACCCRGCLAKWHRIPQGRELTSEEKAYGLKLDLLIHLGAFFDKLDGLFLHAFIQCFLLGDTLGSRVIAYILRYFHGAEMRAAHGAEMRDFGGILGQCFVVEITRLVRVEAEVELVFPAEFEARFG